MQQRRAAPVSLETTPSLSPSPSNPFQSGRQNGFRDTIEISDSDDDGNDSDPTPMRTSGLAARRKVVESDTEDEAEHGPPPAARQPALPSTANQGVPVVEPRPRPVASSAPPVERPPPVPIQQIQPNDAPRRQQQEGLPSWISRGFNKPPPAPTQPINKDKALPTRPEPLQDHNQPRPYNPYLRNAVPPSRRAELTPTVGGSAAAPPPSAAEMPPVANQYAAQWYPYYNPAAPYNAYNTAPPGNYPVYNPTTQYSAYNRALPGSSGNPIAIPTNPPAGSRVNPYAHYIPPSQLPPSRHNGSRSTRDVDDVPEVYVPPAEAQQALQDLFQSSVGDAEIEGVDMERDSHVDGFRDTIKLMPHQVRGRMWMKSREEGKAKGGILADDMGLGKTIQTFTRIVDGKRTDQERIEGYARATLIVCPVGLIKQWKEELSKMTVGLRVIEHHGAGRTKDASVLERADVVVTSYSVVASEHAASGGGSDHSEPKKAKAKTKSKNDAFIVSDSEGDDSDNFAKKVVKKTKKKTACALFEVDWLRIVLDEAQNIKNKSAKMSIGCCALSGKYKWCLTGTPIQNSVDDLYPLLKFLGVKPLNDWTQFRQHISQPVKAGKPARPMKRLQVILKVIMLRRTKNDQVNGQPLLKLPSREVKVVKCEFDNDELEFYAALQARTTLTFNKFLKRGDVMKNYTSVLVLLLRMRQACGHPGLVSKDFGEDKDALEPKLARTETDEQEVTRQEEDELTDLLGKMSVGDKAAMCKICLEPLPKGLDATVCVDCDKANIDRIARRQSLEAFKPSAYKPSVYKPSVYKPSGDELDELDESDASIIAIPRNEAAFPRQSHVSTGGPSLPPSSAKIRKIVELLTDIANRSNRQEKTIIFSQFTGMLDLIEPFLKHHRIKFSRIDGSLRPTERELAINKIKNDSATTVILISFKAGGVGLNLVCCNNVILVDLWWNPALEDQAFDRAHRLGQTRAVNIYKLVIENTVEDRILTLQDKKREVATVALSGGKLSKNKLELNDLIALFRPSSKHDDDDDD
ncbi:hypothetical protein CALCODRAFT_473944 [Calocera cornea HHB12733]|uniref:P-loop containing nucleoside triphosphate hydrolase protein n=1 Tax=Calocera cornea HHB12733 TaxID=1353952 RepID=A0A165E4Y2_9BASI|nr:hypothetical protein CALCODRAFT_473944 [Calocera cornea HHB12733]